MRLLYTAAIATIALLSLAAFGQEHISLDEIAPGMTGHGWTVVAGQELVKFDVKVVDVLTEPGLRQEFIVIDASGEAIERSGGIAQGMSGSPVYLDGRLAGALSRAFIWVTDRTRQLGLVTPIDDIQEVVDQVAEETVPDPEIPRIRPAAMPHPEGIMPHLGPTGHVGYSWPLAAPVVTAGLSDRTLDILKHGFPLEDFDGPLSTLLPSWARSTPGLHDLGIRTVLQVPGVSSSENWELRPGGPVGVGLMVGDMIIGALGTVTTVQGTAVAALGHHFLFSGPSRYFLMQAHVLDTVSRLDVPVKFGTLGAVEGGVYADRWAAVGARTDLVPSGVELSLDVLDLGRSDPQSHALNATMAQEPRLQALMFFMAGLEASDRALDRMGPGTVTVRYSIEGEGMPAPLTRENVFLSTEDVAVFVPWEAAMIVNIMEYNEFADPELGKVQLSAEVRPDFQATQITDLVVHEDAFAPGDTVAFTVYTKDWRGEVQERTGEVLIPPFAPGPYVELRAYGGPRPAEKGEAPPQIRSLPDLIDYIEQIPPNNLLTVELFMLDARTELTGVEHLVGVDGQTATVDNAVVYGEVSIHIPLRQED